MVRLYPTHPGGNPARPPPAWSFDAARRRIEVIEEVFDFTMLTSIKNFWDGAWLGLLPRTRFGWLSD